MSRKLLRYVPVFFLLLSGYAASAQSGSSGQAAAGPPVSYASVSQLNMLLSQIEQAAQGTTQDLGKLRIERWKTDSGTKRQSQANRESVQRNLQNALPEIINRLRASPEDLTATFKLYRNMDALYDVFGSLVEAVGAFGSKDEFQTLSNDLSAMEQGRRALADRMDNLTTSKEAELVRLRTQVKAQAAAPPAPPKKVVVDDSEAPKKPAPKKKTSPKTSKPAAPPTGQQPSNQQPPSSPPQ